MRRVPSLVQVGKFFPPVRGGMETYLGALVKGIDRFGDGRWDTSVLVFNKNFGTREDLYYGARVTRLSLWEHIFSVPFSPSMFLWLRKRRFDVLHLHSPNPTAEMAVLLNPSCRRRLVVSYVSDVVRQRIFFPLYRCLLDRILSAADAVIVSSRGLLENSEGLAGCRDKCRVVPFGIDLDEYPYPSAPAEADPPFVLFVGRLVYYKGVQYLVEAARRLGRWKFVIAGDGPYYATLKMMAEGMEDRVVFTGEVDDMYRASLMRECALLVLPSVARSETFGIVQLEAMACWKPVINTSLPTGVPEVSLDGITGFTVPPCDVDALAEAVDRLMSDSALRSRMGEAARRRVEERFSLERMARETISVYDEVL